MVCSLGNMGAITLHQKYDQLVANRGCPAHMASNLEAHVLFVASDCTVGRCRHIRSCALAANTKGRARKDLFVFPPRFIASLFIMQTGDALPGVFSAAVSSHSPDYTPRMSSATTLLSGYLRCLIGLLFPSGLSPPKHPPDGVHRRLSCGAVVQED
jgi:hypothetical protein